MVRVLTFNLAVVKGLVVPYLNREDRLLDLGCGVGAMCILVPPEAYLGIDIDEKAVAYAEVRYPGYSFQVADATSFRPKQKFGQVMVVGVLHHMPDSDVAETLKTVEICLQKGGRLIIVEAIPPLIKFNLVGLLLRHFDKGKYIRALAEYRKLVEARFKVVVCQAKAGGVFDYAFIVAT